MKLDIMWYYVPTLLLLYTPSAWASVTLSLSDSNYARAFWIPCVGFHRDCYPGFEMCYDRRYCMLNTWILLSIGLFAILCLLGVLLIFYFVLFRRGKYWIGCIIGMSIAAFLLTLAVFITLALFKPQELKTPDRGSKFVESEDDDSNKGF